MTAQLKEKQTDSFVPINPTQGKTTRYHSPKFEKLTIKQKKFIKEYLKSGNGTQSVLKVYDTTDERIARGMASETLSKPNVNLVLLREQERQGLTEEYLTAKMKEGLNASETKFFAEKGTVKDSRKCKDFPTRSKYLEMTHKLRGDFTEKFEHSGKVEVDFSKMDRKKIIEEIEKEKTGKD